jgi:hypothetical protein
MSPGWLCPTCGRLGSEPDKSVLLPLVTCLLGLGRNMWSQLMAEVTRSGFVMDWMDRGAHSKDVLDAPSLWETCKQYFALATPALALLDRLTPTFSPLVTFRVRILILIVAALVCLRVLNGIIRKKEGRTTFLTYSHSMRQRRFAKYIFAGVCLLLIFLTYDVRFFWGYHSAIEGLLLAETGKPLFAAKVTFLDLDRKPIALPTVSDSQTGRFVLDPREGSGRAAYLKVTTKGCELTEKLVMTGWLFQGKNAETINESGRSILVVHSGCTQ